MELSARVCPFCGETPGGAAFCSACGRNLTAVERLPTREEWERTPHDDAAVERDACRRAGEALADRVAGDARSLADRCAEATADFLAAMRAAGNPGTQSFQTPKPSAFRRARRLEGWVLWPVDREDFERPQRYEPGLFISIDGNFHRLDSELRGWGQRVFPYYEHTVSLEPVEMPAGDRLLEALAALRGGAGDRRG